MILGADVSTLTEKTSKKLGLVLKQPERQLTGADGSNLKVAGVSEVCIKSTYCCVNAPIYVLSGSKSNLLGMPELRQLNLLAVVNATCTNEFDPVKKFNKVFEGLATMPGLFSISLKRDVEPVKLFAPRSIAAGLRQQAKKELDKMFADDDFRPSVNC